MTKNKPLESKIREHKKYYRQCAIRVRSGIKLIFISILLSISMWFIYPKLIRIGVGITVFFILVTALEFFFAKKHKRAIQKLEGST
jgi:hypothetical protein